MERLHDDRRQVVAVPVHQLAGEREIVELGDQHLFLNLRRDTAAVRNAVGVVAGARRYRAYGGVVVAAVERPFELEHLVASSKCAGNANRVECRLGTGADEANLLGAGHGINHHFRQPNCRFIEEEIGRALRYLGLHRRYDRGMGMTDYYRTRAQDAVDVLPAGHVPHVAAAPVGDHQLIFVRQTPQARRPSRKNLPTQCQKFLLRIRHRHRCHESASLLYVLV